MDASGEFNETAAPDNGAEEWFGLGPDSFPAVPRPETVSPEKSSTAKTAEDDTIAIRGILPLPVADTPAYWAQQEKIDAAMVVLSQSPTARKLAATAIAAGFSIVVDPPVISGAGPEADENNLVMGATDHLNKQIRLKGNDDPVLMAIVIAHELAHVSQNVNGGFPFVVSPYHPLSSLKMLMAMEGDARAHEFLVAYELAYAGKDDPAQRLLFPQAIDIAADNMGSAMAKRVIEKLKPRFPDEIDPKGVMAAMFTAFYSSPGLRLHYEDTILHAIDTVEQLNPGTIADEKHFTREVATAEILERLDSHNVAYLQKRADRFNLDGADMTALHESTLARLGAYEQKRRENPLVRGERSWTDAPPMASVVQAMPAAPQQSTAQQRGPAP